MFIIEIILSFCLQTNYYFLPLYDSMDRCNTLPILESYKEDTPYVHLNFKNNSSLRVKGKEIVLDNDWVNSYVFVPYENHDFSFNIPYSPLWGSDMFCILAYEEINNPSGTLEELHFGALTHGENGWSDWEREIIMETEEAMELSELKQSLEDSQNSFILDDFSHGYTDFDYLAYIQNLEDNTPSFHLIIKHRDTQLHFTGKDSGIVRIFMENILNSLEFNN